MSSLSLKETFSRLEVHFQTPPPNNEQYDLSYTNDQQDNQENIQLFSFVVHAIEVFAKKQALSPLYVLFLESTSSLLN